MTLKVPDVAEVTMLGALKAQLLSGARIRLFKNDIVPGDGDTASTYVEATFSTYSNQQLPNWGTPATSGGVAVVSHPAVTWSVGSAGVGNNIYGYYVTDSLGNTLYYAERDPAAPVNMNVVGNTYSVTPQFTFHSEF